jgi:hypothetical protein
VHDAIDVRRRLVALSYPRGMRLEEIRFVTPCNVPWESMIGDERVRSCMTCQRKVYNLSSMSRAEAEAFLDEARGRECLQLYRRPDGSVVTTDCGAEPAILRPPPPPLRTAGVPVYVPPDGARPKPPGSRER